MMPKEKRRNAPVVVFGYNRKNHLQETMNALMKNYGASETDVFLFLDGNKSANDKEKVQEVWEYAKYLENGHTFHNLVIEKNERNQGLASSVINGVTKVIKKYGTVIVVEDDILTTKDFLNFMNDALEFYELNKKIWSISGYADPLHVLNDIKEDVYVSYRASCWGWATWLDRWEKTDFNVSDYQKFRYDLWKRHCFNRGGTDMASMLDRQMAGIISSWAIRWCYSQYKNKMLAIQPTKTKVRNIGLDGSGTNCGSEEKKNSEYFCENEYILCTPEINRNLIKEYRKIHILSLKSRVRRFFRYNFFEERSKKQ